ncbi:MAG: SMC-Scp complex subunit ScpB [Candidatus Thorarchaeota archaeon]|nr:MAG: SMC-Scp complex subunit ScpB [Candidatus Thorarchaeota archaeon]
MFSVDEDMVTLEAALYVAGRPLTIQELAEIIGKAESTTEKLLSDLEFEYRRREGALEVVQLPRNRYVLQLKPELTPRVGKLIPGGLLSFSTLQTLVYIALKQPILQSDLVAQRGTHVYDHVRELVEKKFVEATPEGRSKLLRTTTLFADYFGFDHDVVRLKAQLKHKMKQILQRQKEAEEQMKSAY